MIQSLAMRGFGFLFQRATRRARREFEAECANAPAVSEAFLLKLLRNNRDTVFGRRHGLGAVGSATDFQRALPLATYEDFHADIERIARGEQNVLTADPVVGLYLSSGTTGRSKQIPGTAQALKFITHYSGRVGRSFVAENVPSAGRFGPGVMLIGAGLSHPSEGGLPTGSLSAFLMRDALRFAPLIGPAPAAVYEIASLSASLYLHLLFALPQLDLSYFSAPFIPVVLEFMRTLEQRGPELVEDLGRGRINAELDIAPAMRTRLERSLKPNHKRARALEQALAQGSADLAPRLWPQLAFVSAIWGGSFTAYVEPTRHYLGTVPFFSPAYGASEALMGIGMNATDNHYVVPPGAGFYEYIPVENIDQEQPETCRIDQLEVGRQYEVVVTAVSGLYRYRIGDVVEVVGFHQRAPVLAFSYRRGTLLNLAAEKTSEDAAQVALLKAIAQTGLELIDYTILPDLASSPPRYIYLVELPPEQAAQTAPERLSKNLENSMRAASPYYGSIRDDGRLGPLTVQWVSAGGFAALRDHLSASGASPSQIKIPRVVRRPELVRTLLSEPDPAVLAAAQPSR